MSLITRPKILASSFPANVEAASRVVQQPLVGCTEKHTKWKEERQPRAAFKSCLTVECVSPWGLSHLINLPKESLSLAVKPDDKAPLQMPFLEFKCDEGVMEGQVPTDASLENIFFQFTNHSTTHNSADSRLFSEWVPIRYCVGECGG